MYKRFSLTDLTKIQNNFIPHFYAIIKREKCQWANDFFKICFREGNDLYYFYRSDVVFRISKHENQLSLIDEEDKIEVVLPFDQKWGLNSLVMKYVSKKERQIWQKTIEQLLMDEFKTGKYFKILDKPYLVYDIETTTIDDLRSAKFLLAYAMFPNGEKMEYRCIMQDDLKAFVDEMLAFDGYIVGFNQIWFDNPVSARNVGYGDREIEILNQKSIDLYVFFQTLTKRRIWLNKLSEALVGVQKTLSSGAEWEVLWRQYQDTGDEKYLDEFKKYCKNDVRMTALVMFYFLHYKKIFMDGEEYPFDIEEFVAKSRHHSHEEQETPVLWGQNQSIF